MKTVLYKTSHEKEDSRQIEVLNVKKIKQSVKKRGAWVA